MDWTTISTWWSRTATLQILGILLLGQLVSFLLALMSITSSLIAQFGVDAPLTQSLFTYGSLALVYGSILLYRHQKPLVSWYWYLLLGFADAQGCYLVIKAYQYTSVTSVTLLDCWTVPWAILLTWIFLGTRYSLWQLCGGTLCVLGLSLVLFSDTWDGGGGGGGGGSKPILGDVLVIVGTVFFAVSNVVEVVQILRIHLCCKIICNLTFFHLIKCRNFVLRKKIVLKQLPCLVSVLELKTLKSIKWSGDIVLAFAGYGVSSFIYCSLAPFVLKFGGSAMFNLSLLTSDMWAVLFRVFIYHQKVDWLYFVSFLVVGIGLIIYSTTEKKLVPASATTEDENLNTEYQILNGESESTTLDQSDSLAS
ncbi:putative solute carrier family 35 member SLC35F1/F2/F6 [Medicago truncatula]|uniref:Putative solute carrier family 35 member SLC35F1/F2/F6 n=1 Tax=Medicago truncatula TaxID=3880 RepID=A0A396HCK7_MEDTR|nr:putative solute carrier family 35 member SLC35F1/F2/F6 [Medicago truncatula]